MLGITKTIPRCFWNNKMVNQWIILQWGVTKVLVWIGYYLKIKNKNIVHIDNLITYTFKNVGLIHFVFFLKRKESNIKNFVVSLVG